MCENVNINVSETNETINIVSSEIQEVIDINVYESTEDVTLNITENLIQVNINKVLTGIQNLQNVTDEGNTTTNSIIVDSANYYSVIDPSDIGTENKNTGAYAYLGGDGVLGLSNGTVASDLKNTNNTQSITLEFPDKIAGSYTIATTTDIPASVTNTSDLINDGEDGINPFITAADVTAQVNSDWDATSGVAEILNKPTIPAAQVNSDWNAVSGLPQILNKPTLATVATSGSYTDLSNKPTIPAAQVNSDWNATSGVSEILNKPTIPSAGVISVGLTMPSAFSVANSPITSAGTLAVTGAGVVTQYVRGDGSLANFPTSTGGGASLSFYLNGSVSQGTFGGVAFKEMDRTPILGAGTDFTIAANGYIQSFITDANVPNLLEIPAGNWNFETYFSASSGGGSPSFYVELYKWNGATLSLIASNSATPEGITNGTAIDLYVTALAVPQTTLLATDRLAVRIYVTHSGRTITLHTEDNHLCQVITTFSTGITALNGLTAQVQSFATSTSGTDFAISSATATHTFNLPTASATNRGALSSADWNTFNGKGSGTVTSVSALTLGTTGTDLSSSVATGTTTPVITLNVPTASATNRGALSSTDWTTFNNKATDSLVVHLAGTETITGKKTFNPSVTAASALAQGTIFTPTLVAAANSDVLVGLDINPTFTLGAFTGVSTFGLRLNKSVTTAPATFTNTNDILLRNSALATSNSLVSHSPSVYYNGNTFNGVSSIPISFRQYLQAGLGGGNTTGILTFEGSYDNATYAQIASIRTGSLSGSNQFRVTGNSNVISSVPANSAAFIVGNNGAGLAIANYGNGAAEMQTHNYTSIPNIPLIINRQGGNLLINTATDAGFKLDVNGTARIANKLSVGTPSAASALMEITSTTLGFLPPRMTTTQKNAIVTPTAGLVVYDTTLSKLCLYTTTWETITSL